jgi:thioredoxin-related protein
VKRFLIASVLVTLFVSPVEASKWNTSLDQARAEAAEKDQLIFVEMYATWCGWCRKMRQEVFPSETFQNATTDLVLLRLDTEDGKTGSKLARDIQIQSLPTIVLLTPDMMIAGVIAGFAPAERFVQQLAAQREQYRQLRARMTRSEAGKLSATETLNLARDLASRRAFEPARKSFETLSRNGSAPEEVRHESHYELARLNAYLGNHDDAIATIDRLEKLRPRGETAERSHLLLAEIYYLKKDYKRSLQELHRFEKRYPESALIDNVRQLLPRVEMAARSN